MANSGNSRDPRSFVLPQINPIQLKLDRSNYAFWRALVHSAIRAHGFEEFISSTAISPSPLLPSGSGGDMVPNPEFLNWIRRDQYLVSWMLSSIGESMLGHVVRCRSAREIWSALETQFHTQSKAQTMQYRVQLQTTKKGNLTVEDYFMKMRGIADQLAAIGKPLDDDELVMHIMAGFGPEYEALVVNTMHRADSPNLQEIQLAFQAYEIRLAQQQSALFDHSANIAYRGRGSSFIPSFGRGTGVAIAGGSAGGGNFAGNYGGVGGFNAGYGGNSGGAGVGYGGSGVGRGNKKVLVCQLCGRTGHVALKCFKRFDVYFTGNEHNTGSATGSNNSQKVFVSDLVSTDAGGFVDGDGSWCVDSGATTHITHDFNNLVVSTDYNGSEGLMVGNGQTQSQDPAEGVPI